MKHKERKHSKFSASGAERWFNCQGSVALSEGLPDKSSPWAEEGTRAHEVLERMLHRGQISLSIDEFRAENLKLPPREMVEYAMSTASFIFGQLVKTRGELLVETRIHLEFIHPEMFGTFDAAVVDAFGTLQVFDYKYGKGHAVNPVDNLQMIFYGLGLAHKYDWNFKNTRLWIIQPRVRGYDGPTFWDLSIQSLKKYVDVFKKAVEKVEKYPRQYTEGQWCHWCKAKAICPLKQDQKLNKAKVVFSIIK